MATPRKRLSSRIPTQVEEKVEDKIEEKVEVEELLDDIFVETFEIISEEEETIPEITPTDDPGSRFIESPSPAPVSKPTQPEEKKPRRHPRNTPKFSRTAK